MNSQISSRTELLISGAALATAATLASFPQVAQAQAFQATPNVVVGTASIDRNVPNTDTITIETPVVVIDWTPDEISGTALDFLPTGGTGIFQNGVVADFSVLNRILPSTNGDMVFINGSIISQIDNGGGFTPGGFVAFYSPTGILIGPNATFDVGGLMLTTLDPDIASFGSFTAGGTMSLTGQTGTTAPIFVNPGAQFNASPENSFFIAAAARIATGGTANINGSTAYIAGEQVDVTLSNGLFDIVIPVGTAVGTGTADALLHDGTTTGPSSTGIGDNHMIYGVARAQADPISMVFRGNLGFQPAASAGIVNGEIIISANFDVSQRVVAEGSITDGLDAAYVLPESAQDPVANIFIDSIDVTSDILAISSHNIRVNADLGSLTFDENVYVVAPDSARIDSVTSGNTIQIDGDVLVYSDVISGTEALNPGGLNATAGFAAIFAAGGGTTTINGEVLVTAKATARGDGTTFGNATGGQAQVFATGNSTINLNGPKVDIIATADHVVGFDHMTGGTFTGGLAEMIASQNGTVNVLGDALVEANARGAELTNEFADAGTAANAGDAFVGTFDGGGIIDIGGALNAFSVGQAGTGGIAVTQGAGGSGGRADVFVIGGSVTIDGTVTLTSRGEGASLTRSGVGGEGTGGSARASVDQGGTLIMGSDFFATATGLGGVGSVGGNGIGGTTGFSVFDGTGLIGSDTFIQSDGIGGEAGLESGGDGGEGRGGNAFLIAEGTNVAPASLTVTGSAQLQSSGFGGKGGQGDGSTTTPGRGGDGIGGEQFTPNPVDPQQLNGAYILADGNTGAVSVGGLAIVHSSGFGGEGGEPGAGQLGGTGGDGFGGTAAVGLFEVLGAGTIGAGSAQFSNVDVFANGDGGDGGFDAGIDDPSGQAGNGTGGESLILGQVGTLTFDSVVAFAVGRGGNGSAGGLGLGGISRMSTVSGGTIAGQEFISSATGAGGAGFDGVGGIGQGGNSTIDFQDGSITLTGDVTLEATGDGGPSTNAVGADGTGGIVALTNVATPGILNVEGHVSMISNGLGGEALSSDFIGGNGQGGQAFVQADIGSTVTLDSAQLVAVGQGGSGASAIGGTGTGGVAEILADGTGSQITIIHNVPSSKNSPLAQFGFATANGVGGATTGGTLVGGIGIGGELEIGASNGAVVSLPIDPANDPEPVGMVRLLARGIGGTSTVDGVAGGNAVGGNGLISAEGGTVSIGATIYSVFAQGGSSADALLDIDGGNATGGNRVIQVLNGGVLTGEFFGGTAGSVGGDGSGNGDGGDATGGIASLQIDQSTLNLVGRSIVSAQSQGGSGADGGSADGGTSILTSTNNSTVNITANAAGVAELVVGGFNFGGAGTSNGGNATAGDATALISETTVTGGQISVIASAIGGQGTNGDGGDVAAGTASLTLNSAILNLTGRIEVSADAQGGVSLADGEGGGAVGGDASVNLIGSQLTIAPDGTGESLLGIGNDNIGGSGDVTGDAAGGSARLFVNNESSIQAGTLDLESAGDARAIATGSAAGSAEGGIAEAIVVGASVIDVDDFIIASNGESSLGGQAFGGTSSLFVGPNGAPNVDAQNLSLVSNGIGGDTNGAGRFFIDVEAGTVQVGQLTGVATGNIVDPGQLESSLVAEGGDLIINTNAVIDVLDDFVLRTGMGSTIGGLNPLAPTGSIAITSQGTISLFGDDANFVGISGDTVALRSRDLDINTGAVLGANALVLESLNTVHTMIIGGEDDGDGYTLTAAETVGIEIFSGGSVSITAPELVNSTGDETELILRDLDIFGTLDDGIASVNVFTPGIARVEGQVIYNDAGPMDTFDLQANERLEIVTPGGIAIVDTNGNPTGALFLSGGDIWAADEATITQLQANPNFTGRNDQLMTAIAGSDDPLGYIRAGGVDIFVDNSLLVRNTGTTEEPGGLLVGAGTLSIRTDPGSSGSSSGSNEIDVFAYGRKQNPDGSFTTGEAFYDLVNFNQIGTGATSYAAGSEFNDCDINSGECANGGGGDAELIEKAPPINNPAVIEAPANTQNPTPPAEDESNAEFGVDFPGLVSTTLLSEDPLLEDPVSSGGDSALYSLGGDESDEDDDDDEGGERGGNSGE